MSWNLYSLQITTHKSSKPKPFIIKTQKRNKETSFLSKNSSSKLKLPHRGNTIKQKPHGIILIFLMSSTATALQKSNFLVKDSRDTGKTK